MEGHTFGPGERWSRLTLAMYPCHRPNVTCPSGLCLQHTLLAPGLSYGGMHAGTMAWVGTE